MCSSLEPQPHVLHVAHSRSDHRTILSVMLQRWSLRDERSHCCWDCVGTLMTYSTTVAHDQDGTYLNFFKSIDSAHLRVIFEGWALRSHGQITKPACNMWGLPDEWYNQCLCLAHNAWHKPWAFAWNEWLMMWPKKHMLDLLAVLTSFCNAGIFIITSEEYWSTISTSVAFISRHHCRARPYATLPWPGWPVLEVIQARSLIIAQCPNITLSLWN